MRGNFFCFYFDKQHFREELKINIDDEEHVHEHEQQQINENPDQRVDECRHQIQSKNGQQKRLLLLHTDSIPEKEDVNNCHQYH